MIAPEAERVSRTALRWVRERREEFALPEDVLDPATDVNRTLKPLGELTQVCVTVSRRLPASDPRHQLARRMVEFAWDQTGRGQLFEDLARAEPFATYPLEIYAAFRQSGHLHAGFERFCATLAATRGWRRLEQVPNRRLGVLNSERRIQLTPHASRHAALARTWLGGLPEPWTFERDAGYGLTHVVFHLSDWGNNPRWVPSELGDYLGTWLPAWLDGCLEDEQWDLACELLAVAACLPQPPPRLPTEGALSVIASAQRPDGGISEVGAGSQGRASGEDFAGSYHSTLMAAFAATLTLARLSTTAAPHRSWQGEFA
ncbi:hypothetical protein [Streptomyces sp. NPDC005438]|uniref:DUF6895 family protein n=1 Tax=Streptomyces sp. NPDC005438 TaxID=3156880 RepID=UPI0033A38ECF